MEPLSLSGSYRLVAAIFFGAILGFILVRSQLAWRQTLLDQFSMKNSQFLKTVFTGIAVGILLFYFARKYGFVQYNIRPTNFWGAAMGGMLCAAGAVFCGLLPSTAVAALGTGRIYAIWTFAGMLLAMPFVYYISKAISGSLNRWPVPSSYNDRLDQFFSGTNLHLWFAGFAIILALFFEFVQFDDKKDDSE